MCSEKFTSADTTVTYKTKKDAVVEAIREAIISGQFEPGARLRQNELAQKFRVSPTPVREALRQLEVQGLVQYSSHKGVRVADFDLEEVAEIYRIRAALEALAIGSATSNLDQASLEELDGLVRSMAAFSQEGDNAGLRQVNRKYHRIICEACGLPRLIRMLRGLQVDFPRAYLGIVPGRRRQALREHQAILEALKNKDARLASELMQQHIENAATALQSFRKTQAG